MNLSKRMVAGTLMAVSSLLIVSQPVLAESEMGLIDRIRPVGKVKISADRDVSLVESLTVKAEEEPVASPAVVEAKEAVIEAVDQAAEATKEVVEQAAVAVDSAVVAVNEATEAAVEQAAESVEKVEQVASEVVGKVEEAVAAVVAQPVVASNGQGLQVFNKTCFACHGTGIPGFPKVGDKAVWAPRIAQGKAVLVDHVINGFNAMPARGGNPDLSDAEIEAAVDYLIAEGS